MSVARDESDAPLLPRRPRGGHKGTFGTLLVVGGCARNDARMLGAPALAGLGALRAGCGLVRVAAPSPVLNDVIALCPSATGRALPVDDSGDVIAHEAAAVFDALLVGAGALVVGPGLGRGEGPRALTMRALCQDVPVVLDADALTALAETPEPTRDWRAPAVLTPHPGEYRRLAQALRLAFDPTDDASRPDAAAALAQRLGCVVVLKGARSVVSDGQRAWVCERGHPCLATAGTGDVLAGLIGGLAAQHPSAGPSLYDLARLGVGAHAAAGEAWARTRRAEAGLLASELASLLPAELERVRAR